MTGNDRRPPRPRKRRPGHLLFRLANKARNALGPTLFVAVLVLLAVIAISMVVIDVAERRNPHVTSIWSGFVWVVLALVAAPPWAATTPAGKVIKYVVNLIKPTTIALMTAALTTYLFQLLVKRNSGMGRAKMKDHIVLCGWSSKGAEIIKEIRGRGDEESERPIVILADLHANPTKDDLTTFVH